MKLVISQFFRFSTPNLLAVFLLGALLSLPQLAFAAAFGEVGTFVGLMIGFINGVLIPLVFALALLLFIWGLFNFFFLGAGDEAKRETGKSYIVWSVFAFVLMSIIIGLVNLLAGGIATGLGGGAPVDKLQTVPGVNMPN